VDPAIEYEVDLSPPPPERVGRYRIGPELAQGGMAAVHLAFLDREGGAFAIKLVHRELADEPDFVEMFLDEARLASRLVHPNVCRVHQFGEADDTLYLAMELMRGVPLNGLARRMKLEPALMRDAGWRKVVARIAIDACLGLHAAHELRDEAGQAMCVVHRDVSPQNLFVGWCGRSKVLDFGIAKAEHRLHQTRAGTIKGKFAYMAPEQMRGAKLDRRVDVWAMGVVLWELLAGRPLFRRKTDAETVTSVMEANVPALEGVEPELFAIVKAALARDAKHRTESALAVANELEAWLASCGGCSDADVAAWLEGLFPGERESFEAKVALEDKRRLLVPFELLELDEPAVSAVRHRTRVYRVPLPAWIVAAFLVIAAALAVWSIGRKLRAEGPRSPEKDRSAEVSSTRPWRTG
jgi:eukaryotic-like serine/threonine-protein kinase